jgi:alkylation response protein AidB-like acyl-CoA dehydrogenase
MDDSLDIGALRTSIADVLANECDRETVLQHTAKQAGPLLPLWAKATELGWLALGVPESHGGLGLGIEALVPLYEELGRVAAPLPMLSTMLAADLLGGLAPDELQASLLPRIAEGAIATLSPPPSVCEPGLALKRSGAEIVLSGKALDLIDARDAELILVTARDEQQQVLWVAITADDHPQLATRQLWDHGHTLSDLLADELRLPAGRAFASAAKAEEALLTHAALGLAAEAVGGAEGILDLTIEYLKTRQQFGKPIGSFQALKHRVADHRTRTVASRSLLEAATRMAARGDDRTASEASSAKAMACETYADTARDCIQLHGGMGFTAEQACHLYFKRAYLNCQLFGDAALHLTRATIHLTSSVAA